MAALLCYGIVWANHQSVSDECTGIRIEILNADSTTFVNKKGVLKELQTLGYSPVGKKLSEINTEKIEQSLTSSEYFENVECVLLNDGTLLIKVRQMIPIMRVFDGCDSYYVNINGKRMHASAKYYNDVPVVQGHFTHKFSPLTLVPLIQYVQNDKALSTLVTMYSVRDSNNIFVIPCIRGHVVNMGNVQNVENKFAKLLKFYREVMPVKGWMTYDTISLKWDHQIVASKRIKTEKQEESYDPNDDEQAPDLSTILVGSNMKSDPKTLDSERPKATEEKPEVKKKEDKKDDKKESSTKSESKKSDNKGDKKKSESQKKEAKHDSAKTSSDKVKNAFKKK